MSPQDYERIKEASRILSKEEHEAQQRILKAEREATIVRVSFSSSLGRRRLLPGSFCPPFLPGQSSPKWPTVAPINTK